MTIAMCRISEHSLGTTDTYNYYNTFTNIKKTCITTILSCLIKVIDVNNKKKYWEDCSCLGLKEKQKKLLITHHIEDYSINL